MKNLSDFLNEAKYTGLHVIPALNSIIVKFSPREIDYSYEGRTSAAKEIEAEIISKLKRVLTDAEIYSSMEYAEAIDGTTWSPKYDLENGDIIIVAGGETFYIDVKVASCKENPKAAIPLDEEKLGPIGANSIMNFANNDNHIYWVFNYNGTISHVIDGPSLYKEFMKDPVLMTSVSRDGKNINLKAKVMAWGDNKPNGIVCAQDFISTKWIYDHINKIIRRK